MALIVQLRTEKGKFKAGRAVNAPISAWPSGRRLFKSRTSSGKLTEGIVQNILTNSPTHLPGIKTRLVSGQVGRVKAIFAD